MDRRGTMILWALFIGYLVFVLCNTVLFRDTFPEYQYNFSLFWSYSASRNGRSYLLTQNILKVALFIPIGFLLKMIKRNVPEWKALLFIVLFSVSIECLQLFFRKGFCELDDVFHNTLGGFLGGLASLLFEKNIK